MAYEEALETREEETAYPNTRGAKKRRAEKRSETQANFHNVEECFDSVCTKIQRDAEEQARQFKQDALDKIVNAWSDDPETSWTHFQKHFQWLRDEFLALFRTTKPDLGKYLSEQLAESAAREAENLASIKEMLKTLRVVH